ncbi:hypothetical protein HRbin27_00055 [bacterium HR27]|nr:hypothetical protein HRbin27_00055 [bacterium HR27]
MFEALEIMRWIVTTLRNDAQLAGLIAGRVHLDQVPPDSQLPAIVVSQHSTRDVNAIGGARVVTVVQVLVKVIGHPTGLPSLATIAERLDEVLHGASAELTAVTVHGCVRTEQVLYLEGVETGGYAHVGGIYQVIARERR